jgi:hypothetical protein
MLNGIHPVSMRNKNETAGRNKYCKYFQSTEAVEQAGAAV